MTFVKGRPKTGGRTKHVKTQVKDWIKDHPQAVDALMKVLYDKGIDGDKDCAIYVIDRIRGKPKISLGIDEEDRTLLMASAVLEFQKRLDVPMIEGEYREVETSLEPALPGENEGEQGT